MSGILTDVVFITAELETLREQPQKAAALSETFTPIKKLAIVSLRVRERRDGCSSEIPASEGS